MTKKEVDVNKFSLGKPLPGQSAAADALIHGAGTGAVSPAPLKSAAYTAPVSPAANTKTAPKPFMLRLPPALAAKVEAAHAHATHAEYSGRHDMILKMLDSALNEYLSRKGVHQ